MLWGMPLEQTLVFGALSFFACSHLRFDLSVMPPNPLQDRHREGQGGLPPTVTGLWGSDHLAYKSII